MRFMMPFGNLLCPFLVASLQLSVVRLVERLAVAQAYAAAEGIDCLQGLPDADAARRSLARAQALVTGLREAVEGSNGSSACRRFDSEAPYDDQLSAAQLLALHENAVVALESAESAVPAAREAQRDHEATVVAGYDALGLAASRLAQVVGVAAGLAVDETPVGRAAARLAGLVADSKASLVAARQALRDATLSSAASFDAVNEVNAEVPPLVAMHEAVQVAISTVAATGASWRCDIKPR